MIELRHLIRHTLSSHTRACEHTYHTPITRIHHKQTQITKTDTHTCMTDGVEGQRDAVFVTRVTDLQYVPGMCNSCVWVCLCDMSE